MYTVESMEQIREFESSIGICPECHGRGCQFCAGTGRTQRLPDYVSYAPPYNEQEESECPPPPSTEEGK
jgi:hypothetical protein